MDLDLHEVDFLSRETSLEHWVWARTRMMMQNFLMSRSRTEEERTESCSRRRQEDCFAQSQSIRAYGFRTSQIGELKAPFHHTATFGGTAHLRYCLSMTAASYSIRCSYAADTPSIHGKYRHKAAPSRIWRCQCEFGIRQ